MRLRSKVIHSCAETIAGAVETVRTLVDEFSTLARFPAAQPRPRTSTRSWRVRWRCSMAGWTEFTCKHSWPPILPKVMADAEAIKRALANLVDNAAEAMQDALVREIQISTSLVASRDAVEITVADTGHGVTQELKEKLFLPYFSTKKRGTGLGLAIVSRIVEDHHGSIRVEENQPVGTRFIVELPLAAEVIPAPVDRPACITSSSWMTNPASASLKGVLEDEGYKASAADSGEACLELCARRSFDVVLLDIWLPGMDGLETLQKIRELENAAGGHHDLRPRHHRDRGARHQAGRLRLSGKAALHR